MKNMLPCPAMNLHQARLIAFDNDGTLYPAGEEVGLSVLKAHREFVRAQGLKLETPGIAWVRALIGADTKEFYSAMMPGQPKHLVDEFEDFCLDIESVAVRENPDLYPGVHELLGQLKSAGKTMVLISNGGPRYVQNVWQTAGYGEYFETSYPYSPPDFASKGQRLLTAIASYGSPAVMVGDRASDREAARVAGAMFIGCSYGYGGDEELAGADWLVANVAELAELLLGEGGSR